MAYTPGDKVALGRAKKGPKGWSQTDLAEALAKKNAMGLTASKWRSRIANYENNRPMPETPLRHIADALNISYSWFLDPDNPIPVWKGDAVDGDAFNDVLPLAAKGRVQMIYAGEVPCSTQWGNPLESTEPIFMDADFAEVGDYVCRVRNDSLYPALCENDLVVWKYDPKPAFGVIVLAQRRGDRACTAKVLMYDKEAMQPKLVPLNPATEAPANGDGWEAVARLVGVERTPEEGPKRKWIYGPGLRPRHLIENT